MYLFDLMFLFSLDIFPGLKFLGHVVILFLVFWETSTPFSMVTVPIYVPTDRVWEFFFYISLPNLLFMVFLMILILTCVRWHIVILICICQMINDVEHLFMCLMTICMSSLKKIFIQFFCLLWNWAFKKILSWMSYLYILDINSLLVITFANIFSHLVGYLFILSMISFAVRKVLSLIRSQLFIFAFISFALRRQIQKNIIAIYVKECSGYVLLRVLQFQFYI